MNEPSGSFPTPMKFANARSFNRERIITSVSVRNIEVIYAEDASRQVSLVTDKLTISAKSSLRKHVYKAEIAF